VKSVATSNRGGLLPRAGRWLSSTKNIAGASIAVAAVGAQAFIGLGTFWPAVVVAAYAVGALVAPRDKVDLIAASLGGSALDADALRAQLGRLRATADIEGKRLGEPASDTLEVLFEALDGILARWRELGSSVEHRYTVEQIITDYLPTAIQGYLNLPRTYALSSKVAGKRTAHEEMLEQLTTLRDEAARIRDAIYASELEALSAQGSFLREKFARATNIKLD
jgi:hypothetical protein